MAENQLYHLVKGFEYQNTVSNTLICMSQGIQKHSKEFLRKQTNL